MLWMRIAERICKSHLLRGCHHSRTMSLEHKKQISELFFELNALHLGKMYSYLFLMATFFALRKRYKKHDETIFVALTKGANNEAFIYHDAAPRTNSFLRKIIVRINSELKTALKAKLNFSFEKSNAKIVQFFLFAFHKSVCFSFVNDECLSTRNAKTLQNLPLCPQKPVSILNTTVYMPRRVRADFPCAFTFVWRKFAQQKLYNVYENFAFHPF